MKKIFVAGHRGMVGSAICRQLAKNSNIEVITKTHKELDLTNQKAVLNFFEQEKPEEVYLAAAKVGGIHANNTFPAEFIYDNLMIEANVIHSAHLNGVDKLLFLGSSCIYPREVEQPMSEAALLTGILEPTNEPYAIAKIAGIKLCESYNRQYGRDYRSVMPTNLYGPGDNYHLQNSHVLPAMIRKFHLVKLASLGKSAEIAEDEKKYGAIPPDILQMMKSGTVVLWGTGTPFREFLHVDDMAAASIFVMNLEKNIYKENTLPMLSHVNVGYGIDITIKEAAALVAKVVGYTGEVVYDKTKPDGTLRKLMDSSRLASLGWKATIDLEQGISQTYLNYLN